MRKRGGTAALAHLRVVVPVPVTAQETTRTVTETGYPKPSGGSPRTFPPSNSRSSPTGPPTTPSAPASTSATARHEYVFYDGPPFANGLPHYGHLLTGYVKDIVPRYQTMRGYKVERRFGWDTHGLPAELEVQRQLGITDKAQIEEMGIEAFNDACRESVLKYTDEWREYVTRQARWVDFDNDYKTLDLDVHGDGASGPSSSCGTRAWPTRASACCRTAGTTRRRCPTTSCAWTTTSTRAARTRRSRSGSGRRRAGRRSRRRATC